VRESVRFTCTDVGLGHRRHAHDFAVVPRERWTAAVLPAADWLALAEADAAERVPYVLAVDADDRLHRVIVDARLMQATRRCLLLWQRLQEHGGVNSSHAEQAVARERAVWEAQKEQEFELLRQSVAAATPAATAAPAAAEAAGPATEAPAASAASAAEAAAAAPSSDEPGIETSRCSSCNECQNINDRLFGYNENKQAFIKDLGAGTYREMIEAAEACQVAIIHPGKPWNPAEPGLEELLERAKPFLA
jgi:ferredoxin